MDVDLKKVDQGKIKAFLSFELMVLPSLIKVLFILGVIGIVLGGISWPFMVATVSQFRMGADGFASKSDFNCGVFAIACVVSLIGMTIGVVWWRVICESMIILFKIREDLVALRGGVPPAPAPAPSAPALPEKPSAPPPPAA